VVRVHEGPPYQVRQGSQSGSHASGQAVRGVLTSRCAEDVLEAFLLSKGVSGCTSRTVQLYREVIRPFLAAVEQDPSVWTTLTVQKYLTSLRTKVSGTTVHLHFSKLRAFFQWCLESNVLAENPMRGLSMKAPKTLPAIPEDEAVRRLLLTCPDNFEGRRNKALVSLLLTVGCAYPRRCAFALRTCGLESGPSLSGRGRVRRTEWRSSALRQPIPSGPGLSNSNGGRSRLTLESVPGSAGQMRPPPARRYPQ
jgi:site-specific recombinase XerC